MGFEVLTGRLAREHKTIKHMLQIYCKAHCAGDKINGLCNECTALLDYAEQKLDRCPYGETKPDCARCPIHCYKPEQRAQARKVMIYAGPRMLLKHPIETFWHFRDKKRPIPEKPPVGVSQYARRKSAKRGERKPRS